jgi:hypothetical protein
MPTCYPYLLLEQVGRAYLSDWLWVLLFSFGGYLYQAFDTDGFLAHDEQSHAFCFSSITVVDLVDVHLCWTSLMTASGLQCLTV